MCNLGFCLMRCRFKHESKDCRHTTNCTDTHPVKALCRSVRRDKIMCPWGVQKRGRAENDVPLPNAWNFLIFLQILFFTAYKHSRNFMPKRRTNRKMMTLAVVMAKSQISVPRITPKAYPAPISKKDHRELPQGVPAGCSFQ